MAVVLWITGLPDREDVRLLDGEVVVSRSYTRGIGVRTTKSGKERTIDQP